jgi:hypothetical protein
MKKILTLGIGTLLIAGAVIPFTNASRDAYHAYVHKYRAFGSYQPSQSEYRYMVNSPQNQERFQLYNGAPYIKKDRSYTLNLPYRPTTYTYGRIANQRGYYNYRRPEPIQPVQVREDFELTTYRDEGFSIQLPSGAVRMQNDDYILFDINPNYSVSVRKYAPNTCADSQGFFACAVNLSKNENRLATHGNADNISTSRIVRNTQFSDTVLNSRIQTRTFTESFSAFMFGDVEKYINRYMVADLDGSVWIVETQTHVQTASEYVGLSKRVFDSFRVY